VDRLVRGQPKELESSRPEAPEFHPEQVKKSSEPGNVIDFVAAKVTVSSDSPARRVARRQVDGSCELSVACRDAMACCCGGLREPSRHFGRGLRSAGTKLRRTSYFSEGCLWCGT